METNAIAQNWEPSLHLKIAADCNDVQHMTWNGANRIAVSGREQTVHIHDFDQSLNSQVPLKGQEISQVCFAKRDLLLVSMLSGAVSVFKLTKEFRRAASPVLSCRQLRAHSSPLFAMDVDPRGTQFVTGGADKIVKLWSMSGQKLLAQFRKHTNAVKHLAYSWDGSKFVSAGDDRETIEWDVRSCEPIGTIPNHGGGPSAIAYLPDGHIVVSHKDNSFRVYDIRTRSPLMTSQLFENPIKKISVHQSGQFLAMCSEGDQCATIVDLVNGSTLTTFTVKMPVRQAAFLTPCNPPANDFDTSDLLCLPGRCRKLNIFETNLVQLVDAEDRSSMFAGAVDEDKENSKNSENLPSDKSPPVSEDAIPTAPVEKKPKEIKKTKKIEDINSDGRKALRMTMARKTIVPKRISLDDDDVDSTTSSKIKERNMSPFDQSLSLRKVVSQIEGITKRLDEVDKRMQGIERRLSTLEVKEK